MSLKAGVGRSLLPWGASVVLVSLQTDAAAQPSTTLEAWIAEARSTPFHGWTMAWAPEDVALKLAADAWPVAPGWLRPPAVQVPDSAVSGERVFGYALVAAVVPMIPAVISSGDSFGDIVWYVGGMAVTVLSVPIAATAAGAPSTQRTIFGTAVGLVAGTLVGGVAAEAWADFLFVPVYSVTMALATAVVAAP